MSVPRSRLTAIALAFAVVASVAVSGIAVASTSAGNDATSDVSFAVRQGGDCYEPTTIGDGSQSVESFYNYSADFDYSSEGTTHLQENQVSNLFLYNGSKGYSLVFLHDKHGDGPYGSTITVTVTGLPESGSWAVEDDNYTTDDGSEQDDNFDHYGTRSEIDWMWTHNRTDGGAFRGLAAEENTNVTIDPAFNEAADEWGDWPNSGDENNRIESWQLLDGNGEHLTALNMTENVTVGTGPCDQTAPTASLSANETTVTVGEPVALNASESSDDEGIVEYRWDFDGDGSVETTTQSATTTHAYANAGEYDATVTVVDAAGNTDAAKVPINVTTDDADTGPVAAFSYEPSNPEPGDEVTFDASEADDPDGEIVEYRWDFDGDGEVDESGSDPATTHAFSQAGDYPVELTVLDDDGATDNSTQTVSVTGSQQSKTGFIEGEVTDTDDNSLSGVTVEVVDTSDGSTAATTTTDSQGVFGPVEVATGEYRVEMTTDGYEPFDETVQVESDETETVDAVLEADGVAPTAALSHSPAEPTVGEDVTLDASNSTDPDGDVVEYRWDVDGNGTVDRTTTAPTTTTNFTKTGDYDLSVTVVDATGNEDTAKTTVTVMAEDEDTEPPTAKLDGPSRIDLGEKARLDASASTDDVGIVRYHWDFDGDGHYHRKTEMAAVWAPFDAAGEYDATVKVVDAAGNADTASVTIEVQDNDPPTADIHAPDEVTVDEEFTVKATNVSDESGVEHVCWYYDGKKGPDGKTMTLSFSEPGTHTVTLFVEDSAGNGQEITRNVEVVPADDSDSSAGEDGSDGSDGSKGSDGSDGTHGSDDGSSSDDNDSANDDNDSANDDNDSANDDTDRSSNHASSNSDRSNSAEPAISVSAVNASASTVQAGDVADLTVTIRNDGPGQGSEVVTLTVNGPDSDETVFENSTDVTLSAGEARNLTHSVPFDEPGEYEVQVGNGTQTITVESLDAQTGTERPAETRTDADADPDAASGDETTSETQTTSGQGPGFGIVSVLLATLLGVLVGYRRL